ncbi:hypothetical protein [Cytobacillus firmus]|uniref:hypothetical protein n=1 Tax=Cytobacillus firmus TaxID=1399 RepID=UPI0018CEC9AE|nr:hypothetical protein [Cytobacillus firmus]MED1906152.1 hypothetical protein [Cytobacillus firmus]MED1941567.1 hypothetical protein [Cytobacillus firmus]
MEIKPPQISKNTMKEMTNFFMKTSIPRIIEARKKEMENKQHEDNRTDLSRNTGK